MSSEELLPMRLVHAFTHWFTGVTTLLYCWAWCWVLGKRNLPIPPQNPFFLLPCTFFPLNSKCASSLCAPALNVWSFRLHLLLCFVERSEELLLQQIFCLGQSLQRAWWFGAPQGYLISPICTLIDKGPQGTVNLTSTDPAFTMTGFTMCLPCVLDIPPKRSGGREAAAPGSSPGCNCTSWGLAS